MLYILKSEKGGVFHEDDLKNSCLASCFTVEDVLYFGDPTLQSIGLCNLPAITAGFRVLHLLRDTGPLDRACHLCCHGCEPLFGTVCDDMAGYQCGRFAQVDARLFSFLMAKPEFWTRTLMTGVRVGAKTALCENVAEYGTIRGNGSGENLHSPAR